MRWILKATLQKGLSALPNEEAVNYRFQRSVTRSLPRRGANLQLHIEEAARHVQVFKERGNCPVGEATFFEFGAGWDLIGPLVYYALGVEQQILVDIKPHLRFELVEDGWRELSRQHAEIERVAALPVRDLGSRSPDSIEVLKEQFGITYLPPRDARDTRLPDESIDFASSTFTLEHIPGPDIERILAESARLLKPQGLVSCAVDMEDHYSFFDHSITPYNYLKFSDSTWRWVNCSLHYQNRLRLSDYLRKFEDAGLTIIDTEVDEPTPEDLAQLRGLSLASRFREGYSLDDLAVKGARIVAHPVN